jgi:hypothetical protein
LTLKVLSEEETLDLALAGASLSRFGDGELKLALGRDCVSQKADPKLAIELRRILKGPAGSGALVCIPNYGATPRTDVWDRYATPQHTALFGPGPYGSAFVSRPDSAPWIDTPDYWAKVELLWTDKDVTLVLGDETKSLRVETLRTAAGVRLVKGPRRDAYADIAAIEAEIGTPAGPVLLCLGPTATVLAARLAAKGVHALDLGHIGTFMRHAGAYRFQAQELVSPSYRQQLALKHRQRRWGKDGHSHAGEVLAFAAELEAGAILDYGCGCGTLKAAVEPQIRVFEYDPGIPGKDGLPKPQDLVVCTDVLEHIEPEKLEAVLEHLHRLAGKGAYVLIATSPAREILPDGRNAHLIVKPPEWWLGQLGRFGWTIQRQERRKGFVLWLKK